MSEDDTSELKRRMAGALEVFTKELTGLRTGRATVSLLEPVKVDAYGGQMTLTQVATVSAPEARLMTVQVWDKSLVKAVEKGIRDANLGLNPVTEGQVIRVAIPPLTEERRKDLIKVAHKYGEQARVSVRNVRRDGMDELKQGEKKGTITEDEHRKRNAQVQTLTDEFIKKIDELLVAKEKDILHV